MTKFKTKERLIIFVLTIAIFFTACSNEPSAVHQVDQAGRGHLPRVIKPDFKRDTFNISRYGAKSDGVTLNTKSINRAIMACSKSGGGVVLVPDGFWLTGPLVLKNNVNLHIQRGALLQFTADFDQYPLIESNYEGLKAVRCQSPISGKGLENIAITGAGVIDGSGGAWRMVKKGKVTASQWDELLASGGVVSKDGKTWYPSAESLKGSQTKNAGVVEEGKTTNDYADIKDFLRPNLLSLFHCEKVLLQGITFQNSPAWCLHPLLCENLTVDGIYAKNPWYAQNGDGIDVESCKNVLIENSTFDVGDDGICMKSGRDEEGRKRNAPTENVLVRNCIVYHAHGGFVIGSEMSGGVRDIYVTDCSFIGTDVGLRFKTTRGRGGVVENIHASHINMRNIAGDAIRFDMYYAAKDPVPLAGEKRPAPRVESLPVTEGTPQFRNFHISNIYCNGARRAIFIRGLPEMNIKDIYFDSMVLKTTSGMECLEADSIYLNHVKLLPADSGAVITLQNSENITFDEVTTDPKASHFMDIMGSDSKNIILSDTAFSYLKNKIRYANGATAKTLQIKKKQPAMIPNFLKITFFCLFFSTLAYGQERKPWAEEMAHTVMKLWKDPQITGVSAFPKWSYDEGVILKGIQGVWQLTGDGDYFRYIQHSIDAFVGKDGSIATYHPKSYKLDDINTGKMLLMLCRVTGQQKYWKAASLLREQLRTQPRTKGGGFWHKKIYRHQMWLDGLYMAEPFYAEYAMMAHEDSDYADIARQFILMETHSRDPETGLLYHGWDASRQQKWANQVTGASPNFWDRAIGWYAMALVDALDYFPAGNRYRDSLTGILNRLAAAIARYQDPASGCWYQVMDKKGSPGNYLEASGSCMFVYALAKGVRKGYLPSRYLPVADKGFKGILSQFIDRDANGQLNLKGTCAVAGLGGSPYRDGSYAYYVRQRPVTNDPKGIGAFILAADEMQIAALRAGSSGKTVTLDNYFNHERKKDITGKEVSFHYVWDDMANSGFSLWGDIFRFRSAKTNELEKAPTKKNLRASDVYIIVDPDTKAENPDPHYIEPKDIKAVYRWVKKGGTLVLMANDSGNCEFTHLNQLAGKFGIHFNGDSRNRVQGHAFEQGALDTGVQNPVFKNVKKVYVKELSTLTLKGSAKPVLQTRGGRVAAAIVHLGKGTVFAVGDPWFYNEYTDGRKLPAVYQNYQAACALTGWLLSQRGR